MRLLSAVAAFSVLVTSIQSVTCERSTASRTLVIGDDAITASSDYSEFFSLLGNEESVEKKLPTDDDIDLVLYGSELKYDSLVILPVKTKSLGPKLTSKILLDYFEKGGNIVAVTGPNSVPESLREFATQLDIFLSPKGYKLVDHFASEDEKHEIVKLDDSNMWKTPIVTEYTGEPLEYQGSSAYLGNSELVIPLVAATSTGYTYDGRDDEDEYMGKPWVQGSQTYLAAAFQALGTNSRFAWTGDVALLKSGAGNAAKQLVKDIVQWTTQQKNVIKVDNIQHGMLDEDNSIYSNGHRLYQLGKDTSYKATFSLWDAEKQSWGPFEASDIQLEFIMLDPYYRVALEKQQDTSNGTVYSTVFKTPDHYGMFTFLLDYKRPGISFVEEREVVTVRHRANDEWKRSWEISNSWIYLTSFLCVVASWFLFVLFYLFS